MGALGCRLVEIDVDQAAVAQSEPPQVVDAVQVVRVRMGVEDAVEGRDADRQQLLAHVRSGVDEHGRRSASPDPAHQQRATAAAVARVCRVAGAPVAVEARHARGRAAAEDGELEDVRTHAPAGRTARENRR